jgi:hypothetical protein
MGTILTMKESSEAGNTDIHSGKYKHLHLKLTQVDTREQKYSVKNCKLYRFSELFLVWFLLNKAFFAYFQLLDTRIHS